MQCCIVILVVNGAHDKIECDELSHETDVVIALQEWSTYHQRLA